MKQNKVHAYKLPISPCTCEVPRPFLGSIPKGVLNDSQS
jgi:hypothetical protein